MKIKIFNNLKNNNSGFGHLEIILVLVVVVIIGVVGFTVFNNQSSNTIKPSATALNYQQFTVNSQVCYNLYGNNCPGISGPVDIGMRVSATFYVCRKYVNIYGGINQVKGHFRALPVTQFAGVSGLYKGPYGVIADNGPRQDGTTWNSAGNSKTFTMNFPAWEWHNFYAVLNDGSQQVHINVNFMPQC
jgi:hypothetical protein